MVSPPRLPMIAAGLCGTAIVIDYILTVSSIQSVQYKERSRIVNR